MKMDIPYILQCQCGPSDCERNPVNVVFVTHGGFQVMHVVDLSCFLGLQAITCRRTLCTGVIYYCARQKAHTARKAYAVWTSSARV